MEKVDLYEARKAELLKLGRKSRIRGKAITEAWLAAHPGISRGECNTPEINWKELPKKRYMKNITIAL